MITPHRNKDFWQLTLTLQGKINDCGIPHALHFKKESKKERKEKTVKKTVNHVLLCNKNKTDKQYKSYLFHTLST